MEELEAILEYEETFRKFAKQLKNFVKFGLVWHAVYRKAFLGLFQISLEMGRNDAHWLENAIQKLVFPRRTISGNIDYEYQNLWIINERLSCCRYLNLSFCSTEPAEADKRPDLTIFDCPIVFAEGDSPFSFVAVVKFERPPRNNHSDEGNPIDQVYSCVKKMREGKVLTREGRPIPVMQNTPFHCYVLCDLTEEIREQAANADLRFTPDGLGYFGYNNTYGCYIEIISYDKAVQDARKRSQVFFDKAVLLVDGQRSKKER